MESSFRRAGRSDLNCHSQKRGARPRRTPVESSLPRAILVLDIQRDKLIPDVCRADPSLAKRVIRGALIRGGGGHRGGENRFPSSRSYSA